MFQFPTFAHWCQCDRCCLPGCPIRRFADLGIFAPPRNFSQLITSFFASESLGILHSPLLTFFCRGLIFINPGYGIYFALARFCSFVVSMSNIAWPFFWPLWRITDSNRWPPACKAGALASWANPPLLFEVVPGRVELPTSTLSV